MMTLELTWQQWVTAQLALAAVAGWWAGKALVEWARWGVEVFSERRRGRAA